MNRKLGDTRERRDYVSYLLRMWRVTVGGQTTWRGSLECPHTGEQVGFASVGDLLSFLQTQTAGEAATIPLKTVVSSDSTQGKEIK